MATTPSGRDKLLHSRLLFPGTEKEERISVEVWKGMESGALERVSTAAEEERWR